MKRIKRTLSALLVAALAMGTLTSCGETTYSAASDFFYSADKGHSYGDGSRSGVRYPVCPERCWRSSDDACI